MFVAFLYVFVVYTPFIFFEIGAECLNIVEISVVFQRVKLHSGKAKVSFCAAGTMQVVAAYHRTHKCLRRKLHELILAYFDKNSLHYRSIETDQYVVKKSCAVRLFYFSLWGRLAAAPPRFHCRSR